MAGKQVAKSLSNLFLASRSLLRSKLSDDDPDFQCIRPTDSNVSNCVSNSVFYRISTQSAVTDSIPSISNPALSLSLSLPLSLSTYLSTDLNGRIWMEQASKENLAEGLALKNTRELGAVDLLAATLRRETDCRGKK